MGRRNDTPGFLGGTRAFVYLALVVEFIEIGEDDLPVAPKAAQALLAPATSPQRRGRPRGRPRTSTVATTAATRLYRDDARRIARGEDIVVPSVANAPDTIPEDVIADTDDLAAVVVKKTLRGMAAGKLAPTLRDGLQAQQLLDRRAEKAADRSFMLNLAIAMAGGGVRTPVKYLPAPNEPPEKDEDIIEGEFSEQNLAPDHLRQA
jgi:hypothetical protein